MSQRRIGSPLVPPSDSKEDGRSSCPVPGLRLPWHISRTKGLHVLVPTFPTSRLPSLLPEYGFREAGRGLPSGHQHRPDHVCRVIQVQSGPRPRGRRSRALAVPCCPAIHAATSLRRYYGRFTRTTALLLRRIVGSRLPASGNFSQRCNTAPLADTPQ